MQQGALFHSLYQQNSGDYINQMRLDVEGLDPQRFREAWQAALDAHEVLRSGFLWQGALEKPLQLVRKRVEVPFSVHDWRDRAGPRRGARCPRRRREPGSASNSPRRRCCGWCWCVPANAGTT
ncbi:condensation domain-containing protein [Pseudomonas aeruginosa]|nr:condensation domain-containing protein [Pseudomonas aeruginosa]